MLEMSNNGLDFTTSYISITYVAHVSVASISPSVGPESGGTPVVIGVSSTAMSQLTGCRFGGHAMVKATVQAGEAVCFSPSQGAGTVEISLVWSDNSVTKGSRPLRFRYFVMPRVRMLVPSGGPTRGGTTIELRGDAFDVDGVYCRFGGTIVSRGLYVSSTVARCVSATMSAGIAHVDVSTNGVDYSTEGVQFEYTGMPSVSYLWPSQANQGGSDLVTVVGQRFFARRGCSLQIRA